MGSVGWYSIVHSVTMITAALILVSLLTPVPALQCYTCNSTSVDRWTKEKATNNECTRTDNIRKSWKTETCTDSRHLCSYEYSSKRNKITRVGCAIPYNSFSWSHRHGKHDTLGSGGNYICWYETYSFTSAACFCNTSLCNAGVKFNHDYIILIISAIFSIIF